MTGLPGGLLSINVDHLHPLVLAPTANSVALSGNACSMIVLLHHMHVACSFMLKQEDYWRPANCRGLVPWCNQNYFQAALSAHANYGKEIMCGRYTQKSVH